MPSPRHRHGHDAGFQSAWAWDGTRDHAAALALPVIFEWFRRLDSSHAAAFSPSAAADAADAGAGMGGRRATALDGVRALARRSAAALAGAWDTAAPLEGGELHACLLNAHVAHVSHPNKTSL